MSQTGKFWQAVDKRSKKTQNAVTSVGVVTSLRPFGIKYNGIDINVENGDTIFINNLMLDDNIDLDVSSMDSPQNITGISPQPLISIAPTSSADYTANISGTQKQFLTDFYTWSKSVHDRFILHIGDYIAVQKLGNNTYIVLDKLQKVENEQ
jgi:hypothetical protein